MNPIKSTIKTEIIPIALILISIIASFYFYANFPETVPTHWNYKGEVDGWSSKAFSAFFFPALSTGLYLIFLGLPYIDPKKDRYKEFSRVYHIFKGLIIGFMSLIYFYIGSAGLGYFIPINMVPIAIGLLFIIMGKYMSQIKPNWFMGIRTPWTLSNEKVWFKTHRLGGKLFMLMGLIMAFGGFLDNEILWSIFIVSIITVAFIPIVYSYILFRRIEKNKK